MEKQSAPTKGYLDYRPELDGFRGLGLLSIMWYHSQQFADVPKYYGGFHMLDMFFTLSGYLITTLLIREWDKNGSIRIGNFYARRALRLLPALFITIPLGAIAVATFDKPPLRPYWQSALGALSYVANWFQLQKSILPLDHTWSLSVEEQYYLAWSAFLVIALKRGVSFRRLGTIALLGAAAMSVARYIAFLKGEPNFAVLSTFTRPDGVLIGSALALLLADVPARVRSFLARRDVGLIAAALFVGGTFVLSWREPLYYRGGLSVFNALTAVLIAHMLLADWSAPRRFLSIWPFPALGRISYGVYLFHIPMVHIIIGRPPTRTGVARVALFFAASIGMGIASWFLVERPVLKLKSRFGSMSRMPALT
jgi:peptidoglycan/LPS O-acetylase OafA/YrhL